MKRSLNLKTSSELSDKVSLHLREMGSSATRSFSMSAMSMETADCEKGTVPNFFWKSLQVSSDLPCTLQQCIDCHTFKAVLENSNDKAIKHTMIDRLLFHLFQRVSLGRILRIEIIQDVAIEAGLVLE